MRALHEEGIGTAAQSFNISTYHFTSALNAAAALSAARFRAPFAQCGEPTHELRIQLY